MVIPRQGSGPEERIDYRRAYFTVPSREGRRDARAATLPAACWERGYSTSMASSSASTRIEVPSKEHSERHPPADRHVRESSEGESLSRALAT